MPPELIAILDKPLVASTIANILLFSFCLVIVAIYRYFVAQVNKKDDALTAAHQQTNEQNIANQKAEAERHSADIGRLSSELNELSCDIKELTKINAQLLILIQERLKA